MSLLAKLWMTLGVAIFIAGALESGTSGFVTGAILWAAIVWVIVCVLWNVWVVR